MNKKILAAAALALVSGAAMADVNLYGIIDASVVSVTNSNGLNGSGGTTTGAGTGVTTSGTANGLGDGVWLPSLFGIKGSEDLGNGMKANFQLESNLNIANGTAGDASFGANNGKLFDRWATVGLSGNWGKLDAGEQLDPLFLQSFLNGIRLAHSGSLAVNGQLAYGGAVVGGNNTIANVMSSQMVSYVTPSFSNTTAKLVYQFGGSAGNNSNNQGQAIVVNYAANGVTLSGGLESTNNATDSNKLKKSLLGASYTMGDVKVAAQFNGFKDNLNTVNAQGYEIGASYNFNPKLTGAVNYAWANDSVNNVTPKTPSVSLKYELSKRTSVWALAEKSSNAVAGWGTLYHNQGAALTTTNGVLVQDQTGVAIGMTHTF
jgi:predicted porin